MYVGEGCQTHNLSWGWGGGGGGGGGDEVISLVSFCAILIFLFKKFVLNLIFLHLI